MYRPLFYTNTRTLGRREQTGRVSNMEERKATFAVAPITNAVYSQHEEASQSCTICKETLGLPRLDGQVETAVVLPCSHIFGSICIIRWLETESLRQDCPNCRRRMIYRECGHAIKPCEVERAPKAVSEKDMPEKCGICQGGSILEEQLKVLRERQLAEERALVGMRLQLPGIFGAFCRNSIQTFDSRIEESKEVWKREMNELHAELQQKHREQW